MTEKYYPPDFTKKAFHCPNCNVYAQQTKSKGHISYHYSEPSQIGESFYSKKCQHCELISIWSLIDEESKDQAAMIYPLTTQAPLANEDMPPDVKEIYDEAAKVQQYSPRATAALLRVALEKLTEHLGESIGSLNTRIKNLKKKGLPEKVIKSLDAVRIIANEGGSHSGTIDLTGQDNKEIVNKLFFLVNFIVEKTISDINKVDKAFEELPDDKKQGVENRDKDKSSPTKETN